MNVIPLLNRQIDGRGTAHEPDRYVWAALAEVGSGLHGSLDGFILEDSDCIEDNDELILVLAFEAGFYVHR